MAVRDTTKTKAVRDWVNRAPGKPRGADLEARRRLWEAMAEFIAGQGGWVVSLPGLKDLRIEVPQGSALPAKLGELGYSPRHCGSSTRITATGTVETITKHSTTGQPIIRQHSGIVPVDILEISLPGK